MARIETGWRDFSYSDHPHAGGTTDDYAHVTITDAGEEAVQQVVTADLDNEDGRSQWVWIRFPNGDLFLAVAPQGETYFATETDHCRG